MEEIGIENGEEVQQTQLPNDVITQQILPCLPIKQLTQCCSNGLVCLVGHGCNYITLWNPTTNQSHNHYPPDFELLNSYVGCRKPRVNWGFGYASSVNDYKVVRVMFGLNDSNEFSRSAHVFSLRSNAWKKIEFGLAEEGSHYLLFGRPRLVNETLYWSAAKQMCGSIIVAFDLVVETFHIFPQFHMELRRSPVLYVMGGCLSKWSHVPGAENNFVVDILKHSGRDFSVRFQCGLLRRYIHDLIGFSKTGKIFAACSNPNRLCLIDPYFAKPLITLEGEGIVCIESYVPSQISPLPPEPSGQVG